MAVTTLDTARSVIGGVDTHLEVNVAGQRWTGSTARGVTAQQHPTTVLARSDAIELVSVLEFLVAGSTPTSTTPSSPAPPRHLHRRGPEPTPPASSAPSKEPTLRLDKHRSIVRDHPRGLRADLSGAPQRPGKHPG